MAKTPPAEGMRRCSGSRTFGLEAHEAPVADFPVQPSRKDGLGTMCRTHWRAYTSALGKARRLKKRADALVSTIEAEAPKAAKSKKGAPAEAGESPAPKARRAKLEAKLAEVGVGSDEGQRALAEAFLDKGEVAASLDREPDIA